jgi:hypothetical protein
LIFWFLLGWSRLSPPQSPSLGGEGSIFFNDTPTPHLFLPPPMLPTSYRNSDSAYLFSSVYKWNVEMTPPRATWFPFLFPWSLTFHGSRTSKGPSV